jgi:hypothetical protein
MFHEDINKAKIIKKVYKILKEHLTKLIGVEVIEEQNNKSVSKWQSDILLFKLRNDKKQAVTIIPGLNIDLIIKKLNEFELETLWYHIYVLFVSSVKIISILNKIKNDDNAIVAIPIFEERINLYNKKY